MKLLTKKISTLAPIIIAVCSANVYAANQYFTPNYNSQNNYDARNANVARHAYKAHAEDKSRLRVGPFIEANVGTNLYAGALVIDDTTHSNSEANGAGWSVALGYNFTRNFGLEGGFMQNYIKYDFDDDDNDDDDFELEDADDDNDDDDDYVAAHTNIPYAAMRFTVPFGNTNAAFVAKLGGMYVSVVDDHEDADEDDDNYETASILLPFTGVGFSYALTPQFELIAQYQGAIYGIVNAGLLSGGVVVHF